MFKLLLILNFLLLPTVFVFGQQGSDNLSFTKRMRVIADNDFSGDPDGLFQLAHLLMSPTVETRGIIGSHLSPNDFIDPSEKQAENAAEKARKVLQLMGLDGKIPVFAGSNKAMKDDSTPVRNDAVEFIIREAMRTDTKLPLYIVCGAGMTEIASALLVNPAIADKFTLIWIGGPEHPGIAFAPPRTGKVEYNLKTDISAGMVVFNKSSVSLWQVPRDAYRQANVPLSDLQLKVKPKGEIGKYLFNELIKLMTSQKRIGETFVLGDSPLVLLTALQTYFEPDPASSFYQKRNAPTINNEGQYVENPAGRQIRVYTKLDTQLMMNDFYSKLELFDQSRRTP